MKTHVWIKGVGEMQYAPFATLVLSIKVPLDRGCLDTTTQGDETYFANGLVVTKKRWEHLKEAVGVYAATLDNVARGY